MGVLETEAHKESKIQEMDMQLKVVAFSSFTQNTTESDKNQFNLKKRFVLVVAVLLMFLIGLIVLYFLARLLTNFTKENSNIHNCSSYFQDKSRQNYSAIMSEFMDISTDPCQDFHQYVCDDLNGSTTSKQHLLRLYYQKMGEILEAGIGNTTSKSKSAQYVMELYEEFVNTSQREQLGTEPIRQLLKQVLGQEQWPLLANYSIYVSSSNLTNTNSTEFLEFWESWKWWKLLQSKTMPKSDDQSNVAQWIGFYVEAAMVGVHSLVDNVLSVDTKAWKIIHTIVLSQVDARKTDGDLFVKYKQIKGLVKRFFKFNDNWNASLDHAIFEVMHFELTLSQILKSKSVNWLEIPPSKLKSLTLSELNQLHSSPAFDWTLLLNKFASRAGASFRYTDDHSVHVNIDQLKEFKPFTELIANTPIRVLKNLMAFQMIKDPAIQSLIEVMECRKMLVDKSLCEKQMKLAMPMLFLNELREYFAAILTRLSVDKLGREQMHSSRDQLVSIVNDMKETFRDSLKHDQPWLDHQTRQNALDKLDSMKSMIAFPDWIFDDDILDEQMGFNQSSNLIDSQKVIKGQYAASYLNIRRLTNSAAHRTIGQIIAQNRTFIFKPLYAAYLPQFNVLSMSHTNLLDSLSFLVISPSLNEGHLGFTIGHEIVHGFDNNGLKYDKHGETANWWTDSASEHFDKLAKCFVRQYDGLVEPITGVRINGTLTLGENIADNGGLNVAYRTFSKTLKHSNSACASSCPSSQAKFTPEQLFFISYAKKMCLNEKNSTRLIEHIKSDEHSPERLRVNVPLSNMDQFAQAFNCPLGSNMNPKHKCSIW